MLPILFLSHAVLGAALVLTRDLPEAQRSVVVRGAAVLGAGSAALLFLTRGSNAVWGAARLEPGPAAVASVAIFCAWAILVATDQGAGRWDIGALVGAGATGLALFATSSWVVPALLFWLCVSGALIASAPSARTPVHVVMAIAVSDACFVGGLVASSVAEETWRMPESVSGWLLVPLAAAVVVRSGVLAKTGVWGLLGGAHAALLPLAIGSSFALVPAVSTGDEIAVALPLLLAGTAAASWFAWASAPSLALLGTWSIATMLAVVWIEPLALGKAAATACLGVAVVALWPSVGGRAQSERALVVAAVPVTIGFGVILGGAVAAFTRAGAAATVVEALPWTLFAALLPAASAAGVTAGAAIGRRVEPETYEPVAVLVTWTLAAVALLLGLAPGPQLGFSSGPGAAGGALPLAAAAVVAAGAAARFAPRPTIVLQPAPALPGPGLLDIPARSARVLSIAGLALLVAASGAVLWFTYVGLKTGFL